MRILVNPVIISSSVGSSVSSPIITTMPTVPLKCRPSPPPTRTSICGASLEIGASSSDFVDDFVSTEPSGDCATALLTALNCACCVAARCPGV